MNRFKADLHLHTVLSPCGDVSMSPRNIVDRCVASDIRIIGITDHNTTRQCGIVEELAKEKGIFVLKGAEITTREEVHLLAFFEDNLRLTGFQTWLDRHLPIIKNKPDLFGYQVVVDRDEQVVYEEERLLIAALDTDINETCQAVKNLDGILIPAHIGKTKNGIFSQLGMIPKGFEFHALETTGPDKIPGILEKFPELESCCFVHGSDAHYEEDIGRFTTVFHMEKPDFQEIKKALAGLECRRVIPG